jgi:hypothetical protein
MKMLRVINPILFCTLLLQAITGLAMFFELVVPLVLAVHKYNALLFLLVIAAHVTFNWPWIRVNYFSSGK